MQCDRDKEKVKKPLNLDAADNNAVTTFTNPDHDERLFETWYGSDTIKYLLHSSPNKAQCLRVIFNDAQKDQEGFKSQLKQLIVLSNKLNRPALFISKEPGCPNHWISGMTVGNQVVIINPVGLTKHHDFYATLQTLVEQQIIQDVFLSEIVLQKDPEGHVSCGPLCVELLMHWSSLKDIGKEVFNLIKNGEEQSKHKLKYTAVNITSLLPPMLQTLKKLNSQDYQSRLTQLRANHYCAHLKTMSSLQQPQTKKVINDYWEGCLYSPEQILFHQFLFKEVNILDLENNLNYQAIKLSKIVSLKNTQVFLNLSQRIEIRKRQ